MKTLNSTPKLVECPDSRITTTDDSRTDTSSTEHVATGSKKTDVLMARLFIEIAGLRMHSSGPQNIAEDFDQFVIEDLVVEDDAEEELYNNRRQDIDSSHSPIIMMISNLDEIDRLSVPKEDHHEDGDLTDLRSLADSIDVTKRRQSPSKSLRIRTRRRGRRIVPSE